MALKHLFSGMAGVPAFFGAAASKNYDNISKRADKWLDNSTGQERRRQQADLFRRQMESNPNLSESDMGAMQLGFTVRQGMEAVGEGFANRIGAASSYIGGQMGYTARELASATASATGTVAKGTAGIAGMAVKRGAVDPVKRKLQRIKDRTPEERAAIADKRQARAKRWKDNSRRAGVVGVETGKDTVAIAKDLYNFTGTKTFNLGVAGVAGAAIFGSSDFLNSTIGSPFGGAIGSAEGPIDNLYESGKKQGKNYHTMQQVSANMSASMNGGGAFIRDVAPPSKPVDDYAATGDLVFALHSLRNGG